MTTPPPAPRNDLEGRVARLEETRDSDRRLAAGVERLGGNVASLNDLLVRVDAQQAQLQQLRRESVTRTEVEEQVQTTRNELTDFSKQLLQRVFLSALLMATFLAIGTAIYLYAQDQRRTALREACENRNAQGQIIIDVLNRSAQRAEDMQQRSYLDDAVERFERLKTNCEGL